MLPRYPKETWAVLIWIALMVMVLGIGAALIIEEIYEAIQISSDHG